MKAFFFLSILFAQLNCFETTLEQAAKQQKPTYSTKKPSSGGIGKVYMGREISFVMDASGASWLERNNRNEEENTALAIANLPINKSSVVADIGAGSGYYSFKIAEKVPAGKVYAVEIQDEFINILKDNKQAKNAVNVEIVKGSLKSPNLLTASIDLAIMVDVYHELEFPAEMLQALYKSLKPQGKILLLEYKAEDATIAIKELHKMSVAQVSKELSSNGFKLLKRGNFLPMQHFLVFEKK